MKNEGFANKTLLEIVQTFAIAGAAQTDAEWKKLRDEFIKEFEISLNTARGNVRMSIMESMFRTDEEE